MSRPRDILLSANRAVFPRLLSPFKLYFVVNEFPKSGGTWISQLLSDCLEVPFPQKSALWARRSICHGHFLSPWMLGNVLTVWRDPRDVMVSFYHQCYFVNEFGNDAFVARMRKTLPFDDYSNVRANMPDFVRFVCTRPVFPRFTWDRFARNWAMRPGVASVRYEDMRADTPGELQRICSEISGKVLAGNTADAIARKHSFEAAKERSKRQLAQNPQAEVSFVRAGSVGGWGDYLDDEAHDLVVRYCGAGMKKLGYPV